MTHTFKLERRGRDTRRSADAQDSRAELAAPRRSATEASFAPAVGSSSAASAFLDIQADRWRSDSVNVGPRQFDRAKVRCKRPTLTG